MRPIISLGLTLYISCGAIVNLTIADQHRIASITQTNADAITLAFAGAAATDARAYYDLYPIEAADALIQWSFLTTLLRTNTSAAALTLSVAPRNSARFYRTASGLFPTAFPKPSGKFNVGCTSFLLTDASRSNRYNVQTNSSFMITLWYPADPNPAATPSAYIEPQLSSTFSSLYGISQTLLASFRACVYESAAFAREIGPCPLIIYSHGFRVSRRDNTATFQELASHGYIVVAIDHSDALATRLPDGRVLRTPITSLSQDLFDNNVADIRFALSFLEELNASDDRFRNALDVQNIGTMGWSYGGGVAAEICRTNPRVKATALLEAYLQNAHDVAWLGVQKPVIGLYNATSFFTTAYDQNEAASYWMRIQGSDHQTFADWHGRLYAPTSTTRAASAAINACIVSFFNKHLRGVDDHLLDNPGSLFPQVTEFMKK